MDKTKKLSLTALLVLLALASALTPTFAQASEELQIGDIYRVRTLRGIVHRRADNGIIVLPASLEMSVRVTGTHGDVVFLRALGGSISVDGATFWIIPETWKGFYNKDKNTGDFEFYAGDFHGNKVYAAIHTVDVRMDDGGVRMVATGVFRDPNGRFWRLDMLLIRHHIPLE